MFVTLSQSTLSSLRAFILLLGVSVLTRLPYFFKSDIDWDEHTFMVLGQSVLDGHLPYTFLLDIKSPFLWYISAFLAGLANRSLFSLRLLGSLWVATIAFLGYISARYQWGPTQGMVVGLGSIICFSLFPGGQAVMSEHLALLPLALAFTLLVTKSWKGWNLAAVTSLLLISSFIRLNLAYCFLAVLCYVMIRIGINSLRSSQPWLSSMAKTILWSLLGCASVLALLVIPYIAQGELSALSRGMIQASLSYSNEQLSILEVFKNQIHFTFFQARTSIAALIWYWFILLVTIGSKSSLRKYFEPQSARLMSSHCQESLKYFDTLSILIAVFIIGIEFSILKTGIFFGHYNIQLSFFVSFLIANPITNYIEERKATKWKSLGIRLLYSVLVIHYIIQYGIVAVKWFQTGSPAYGLALEVSKVLEQENPDRHPVWLQTYHLAYWLNHTYPVTPAITHPSNLHREFLLQAWYGESTTSLTQFREIVAAKPALIVAWEDRPNPFPANSQAWEAYQAFITQNYQGVEGYDSDLLVYRLQPEGG